MKTNAKIYVMQAEDGTIKLGHSRDPAKRAALIDEIIVRKVTGGETYKDVGLL